MKDKKAMWLLSYMGDKGYIGIYKKKAYLHLPNTDNQTVSYSLFLQLVESKFLSTDNDRGFFMVTQAGKDALKGSK